MTKASPAPSTLSHVEILSRWPDDLPRHTSRDSARPTQQDFCELHLVPYGPKYLVLDVQNSFLLAVDDVARCALQPAATRPHPAATNRAVNAAQQEILDLRQHGLLPFASQVRPLAPLDDLLVSLMPISKVTLVLNSSCNLSCRYCFGDELGGESSGSMSLDVATAAVDYLFAHSAASDQVIIEYFGGEPYLSREVLERSLAYAKEQADRLGKRLAVVIVTNGTKLDERAGAYLSQFNTTLLVSIDGPSSLHDRYRVNRDGRGSLGDILASLRRLAKTFEGNLVACPTLVPESIGHLSRIARYFKNLGFSAIFGNTARTHHGSPGFVSKDDYRAIVEEYVELAPRLYAQCNRFPFYLEGIISHLRLLYSCLTLTQSCASYRGTSSVVVVPSGAIYPCSAVVGHEDLLMGTVPEGESSNSVRKAFYNNTATASPHRPCRRCWARFLCSGKCPVHFLQGQTESITSTACRTLDIDCDLERFRAQKAMELAYSFHSRGADCLGGFLASNQRS